MDNGRTKIIFQEKGVTSLDKALSKVFFLKKEDHCLLVGFEHSLEQRE